jgi:alkenylglycerophosphocholine/alkenylglycerophosphoethanolamine hydrolase
VTTVQKIWLYVFAAFALLFIVLLPFEPYPGNFIIKAIPAISLAILAFIAISGSRGKLLFAALLFCAAADIALELAVGKYFVAGLGLFLIAHIFFIITFSRDFKFQTAKIPVIVLLVVYSTMMAFILTPWLEELAIPVYAYMTALTLVGIFAALRATKNNFTLYGAIAFMVSDSVLAVDKFIFSFVGIDYIVMITYYASLFLIVYGLLRE